MTNQSKVKWVVSGNDGPGFKVTLVAGSLTDARSIRGAVEEAIMALRERKLIP